MKAKIYITLKTGVYDPEGLAVTRSLEHLGFEGIRDIRVGKYVEIELDEAGRAQAEASLKAMCERLIANPVMEDYRIEILD